MNWNKKWFGFWGDCPDFPKAPLIKIWIFPNCCATLEKSRFIEFLDDGIVLSVSTAKYPKCPICSDIVDRSFAFMSDGYWIWNNQLIHEVEAHDVSLPSRFTEHLVHGCYTVAPPEIDDEDALIAALDWSMLDKSSPDSLLPIQQI